MAFANGKVVAHQGTLKRLMEEVKGLKKVKKPSVLLVPKKSERALCLNEERILLPEKG